MILASSDENDTILDPFCGSGTSLRVCQQTNRYGIGIEINNDYASMTRARLAQPFTGFDSIDVRMERVPNDLNDEAYRREYIENHIEWFLKNHPDRVEKFLDTVNNIYSRKMIQIELADLLDELAR